MLTRTTARAALRLPVVTLLLSLMGCAEAWLGSPSYQSAAPAVPPPPMVADFPLPPLPFVADKPQAQVTWDPVWERGPGQRNSMSILATLPALPAAKERLATARVDAAAREGWRSECDAVRCFRVAMFDDGIGWDYVVGTLRILDERGSLFIHVSSAVSAARIRIDRGEVFTFRCTAKPATCSLSDAAARRLTAAIRRGNKLHVEVRVEPMVQTRIGVPKEQRTRTFPGRIVRKELELTSFHALTKRA